MTLLYTLAEVAAKIHKSPRWLNAWLRQRPADQYGEPFYTPLGRTKIFDENDLARIRAAAREEERCRLSLSRPVRTRRRIGRSAAPTLCGPKHESYSETNRPEGPRQMAARH
jgi:hypothetical protein